VNELSVLYWAWKNYDKIGNPDYIGLYHYRRMFEYNTIKKLNDYDIIITKKRFFNSFWKESYPSCSDNITIKRQISFDKFDISIEIIKKMYPEKSDEILEYFDLTGGYFNNMFIMKKELFFEYCEFIMPLVLEFIKLINPGTPRDVAFFCERLTGYFLWSKTKSVKYIETDTIMNDWKL
jgi:hypothetical protein